MKSAMTELIKFLKAKRDLHDYPNDARQRAYKGAYVDAILKAKVLLEKEKQQIIDAREDGIDMITHHEKFLSSEDYYNQTFKQ